ncbi:MAG: caspase family protein, partial [Flavobacteriales bacterium]
MKKLLLIFVMLFVSISVNSQTKRALIVAIGNYPAESGWKPLSSIKDYKLVHDMLLNQEFNKENIMSLLDSDATSSALDEKFSELLSNCNKGDMIYFHFSGHGQQVTDTDTDTNQKKNSISDNEADGYDESLVMYSAPKECEDNYDMSKHYIDDRLNYWITEIRKKIVDGHIIMVLDACHSGTASRNTSASVVRGTKAICTASSNGSMFNKKERSSKGFGFDFSSKDKKIGDLIVFSGCRAEEVNYEYKDDFDNKYGSLSYAFVKGMESLSNSDASYYDLYGYINEFIETSVNQTIGRRQHPQIEPSEGKLLKIFDGNFIASDPIYNILDAKDKKVKIDAGTMNSNIKVGDKVVFRLIGKRGGKKLEGKVEKVNNFSSETSVIELDDTNLELTPTQYRNFTELFECTLPYSFKIAEQELKINIDVK